jgi:hypothetical protein
MMDNPLPEDDAPIEEEQKNEPRQEEPKTRPEYSVSNGVQTVISIALVMATMLTLWNPRKVFNTNNLAAMLQMESTQAAAQEEPAEDRSQHIGILAGHWNDNPGEVCSDGIIESDVNHDMADRVAKILEKDGYQVDIFPEFDLGLLDYQGAAFIALYSGSCADDPIPPSGFKIGASYAALNPDAIDRLATCVSGEYQSATKLPFTYEIINSEDASYHIFRDINSNTPAIRLEMGSLKTDRLILINHADDTANAIVSGIMCFLNEGQENQ